MSKTIIYYTSNREDSEFENKIIKNINDVRGDIPVISVSQKPMDFGLNICVGDVGYSYLNAFRQLLIGARAAKTKYVIMCESDCLYPRFGYFDYEPDDPNVIHTYTNVWILFKDNRYKFFYRKEQTHGSLIYGREYLINFLEKCLSGLPMWSNKKHNIPFYSSDTKFKEFSGNDPIINIVTGSNGRKGTILMKVRPRFKFEYWGTAQDLKVRMFNGI